MAASQNNFRPCHISPGGKGTAPSPVVLLPLPASPPLRLGNSGPCGLGPGSLQLVGNRFTRRNDPEIHPVPARRPWQNSKFPRKAFRPRVERKRSSSQSGCYIPSPEPRSRALLFLLRSPESLSSKERKQGMCVLAEHRASATNPMCTQLKVGCPQDSQRKLKETGSADSQTKAGWGFFLFSGSAWNRAGWKQGSRERLTVSFWVCFVPRISTWFPFLFLFS